MYGKMTNKLPMKPQIEEIRWLYEGTCTLKGDLTQHIASFASIYSFLIQVG